MKLPQLSVRDVAERHLCCGCGACSYIAPHAVRMVDEQEHGRRPLVDLAKLNGQGSDAMAVCPGHRLEHSFDRGDPDLAKELVSAWGPVYGVWEGHAADPEIRHRGSSGGAATALALYCIEQRGMHGVLHTAASPETPYLNRTVMSRTREELLAGSGSRYAPASPCEELGQIEAAPGPCVFIGKPCDVAAAQKARGVRPELDRHLGLTIAFFCAGTPSTRGTLELLKKVGVKDPATVESLRYRGRGWPGRWTVRWREAGETREASLSYEESWGFLQKYRQWRCYICPDHTGEFADIAVGDPWYRPVGDGDAGRSLIVARTPVGLQVVRAAAEAGVLILEREDRSLLPRSQPNLLATRASLWGRLAALRVGGAATPVFRGFDLWDHWLRRSTWKQKLQSMGGTFRRIRSKGLRSRVTVGRAAGGAS